jgi:S1-C subfamily serine protease
LHPLTLGDSSLLKVGQMVVAIGNPLGYNGTMTTGIISALGRTLPSLDSTSDGNYYVTGDLIQTDAALNRGNSGGPLLNLNGEVIGVNRAIVTENYDAQGEPLNAGIGFAISVNTVRRVVPELIDTGAYIYPWLGMSAADDLTLYEIELLGLKSSMGAYVTYVVSGGPADNAGLRPGTIATSVTGLYSGGDLITAVDGRSIVTYDDLIAYVFTYKSPGDTVTLTVLRGDQTLEIPLVLGERP